MKKIVVSILFIPFFTFASEYQVNCDRIIYAKFKQKKTTCSVNLRLDLFSWMSDRSTFINFKVEDTCSFVQYQLDVCKRYGRFYYIKEGR